MSLLNNSAILDNPAFRRSFSYTRTPGAYDSGSGKWVEGTAASFESTGSIQPITSLKEMAELRSATEGGARITAAIRVHTKADLVAGTIADNAGDVITVDGLTWSVISVVNWDAHGHKKVTGVRLDGQDG